MDAYDPSLAEQNPYDGQLYNLSDDISESKNLYAEQPAIVKQLKAELDAILK